MASLQSTVDFIARQMSGAGVLTNRKMFGEYAVYVNSKVIGFVCDDALYIKPTKEGKDFFPDAEDAPPYPGAKLYMLILEDKWEDAEFMSELAAVTFRAIPAAKKKK